MMQNRATSRSRLSIRLAAWAALALLAGGLGAQDPAATLPGWGEPLLYCRRAEGNLTLTLRWVPDKGIRLAVVPRQGETPVALHLDARRLEAVDLAGDGRPAAPPRAVQHFEREALREARDRAELTVKFRDTEWVLYLDGELVGALAAPFEPPADIVLPARDPAELVDKPLFRPVPREEFTTDFMIEEGAPNELYPWRIEAGAWHIHTAMQDALTRPESDLARIQQVPLTADKSPNFYSLKGGGPDRETKLPAEAVLTTGYDFFDHYELAAALQLNQGIAGLVFYHRGEGIQDFYALTLEMSSDPAAAGSLCLWEARQGRRRVLSRVEVPLYREQWYRPMVRLDKDLIVAYLDGVEIMRVREPLPIGGKIGLYAQTPEEIRFDDVLLKAHTQVPLDTVEEITYQTLHHDGTFYVRPGFWTAGTDPAARRLEPPRRRRAQTLVVGRPHHAQTVFAATFEPTGKTWDVGLVAGFRDPERPYYRCRVERRGDQQTYVVERIRKGRPQVLETWSHTADNAGPTPTALRLMADATHPKRLDLLCQDRLVLTVPLEEPLQGAMGVTVGPGTATAITAMAYDFERQRHLESQQHNPIFQQDSFMRHWAAPEGQWIGGAEGSLWHKGDFFSDYTMTLPCIPGAVLHAGVPDGGAAGPIRVSVGTSTLRLEIDEPGQAEPTAYECEVPLPAGASLADQNLDFHHEGWWTWVEVNGTTLLRHRLTAPPTGTRCLVKGMTLAHMARSRACRAGVIDDFFNESPHQWTVNGGSWQIINRFQCTPSWSHMAGESPDGMAALWHKTIFSGDIVVEFYAGTRQGWYDRPGDLNCTIMASTTSPSRGYTVTCTEYDYNLSQNWSTLYRQGEVMARSEKYTVPRRRAGLVRKYMDPLIAEGRPVHGAWYYIKLRKIGNRLEYWFDNELVFSTEDPETLQQGLVGIWTYIHSMTLAQVKITFQEARPRPMAVRRLPAGTAPAPAAAAPATASVPAAAASPALTAEGFPLDCLDPAYWSVADTVGHAVMETFRGNSAGLRLTNRLGSGSMHLKPELPTLPLHRLAGWRFQIRRTPGARINLYYSVGTLGANGAYVPRRQYFHHLGGSDFSDGAYTCTGQTAVTPQARLDRPRDDWQTVIAWIPSRRRSPDDERRQTRVRLEGFGEIQPGPLACGLGGNVPGDGYAVRDLGPIFFDPPAIAPADAANAPRLALRGTDGSGLRRDLRGEDPFAELKEALASQSRDGLNTITLRAVSAKGTAAHHTLAWVKLPEQPAVDLGWDPDRPDTLRLDHRGDYPDPRLTGAAVTLDGQALPLEPVGWQETRLARLPRGEARRGPPLALTLSLAGTTREVALDAAAQPVNAAPVLLAIEGLKSFYLTFEDRKTAPLNFAGDGRMRIDHDDPDQGRYLEVRNRDLDQRLSTPIDTAFSIAEFPVMQMRYRAYDMVRASVAFRNHHHIRLNDDLASAAAVRLAHDLRLDEAWHTWTGIVSDGFTQQAFSTARFTPQSLTLGSAGSPDQTGRYSRWHLDDIAFGPAVAKPDQLAFTPRYDDGDGVEAVLTAITAGETAWYDLDDAARAALTWARSEPGKPLAVTLDGLADGVHHLLVRAVDTRGAESAVTDIPFLLDTRPLEVTSAFGPLADPSANGVHLGVTLNNHGGAPWAIEKASFFVAGAKVQIPAWTNLFLHSAQHDRLVLNYPLLCRGQLDAAKDGDAIEFAIDGIVDGAGNPTDRVSIPIKVDFASDKTGPAWYYLQFNSSVHWWWNWDGYRNTTAAFSPGQYNAVNVVHQPGQSPYLQHLSYQANADLTRAVTWKPADHPWLSFRIRRPDIRPRRPVTVQAVLTTTDGRTYTLSLNEPGSANTELNRSVKVDWEEETWHRLAFNVRDGLKAAGVTDSVLANTIVSSVNIQRRGTRHQEALCLDDVFLHGTGAAGQADPLQWYAFDASGVADLQVECVDAADKVLWTDALPRTGADLNTLRAKMTGDHAWLRCRARDQAGNLSVPFWMPLAK